MKFPFVRFRNQNQNLIFTLQTYKNMYTLFLFTNLKFTFNVTIDLYIHTIFFLKIFLKSTLKNLFGNQFFFKK